MEPGQVGPILSDAPVLQFFLLPLVPGGLAALARTDHSLGTVLISFNAYSFPPASLQLPSAARQFWEVFQEHPRVGNPNLCSEFNQNNILVSDGDMSNVPVRQRADSLHGHTCHPLVCYPKTHCCLLACSSLNEQTAKFKAKTRARHMAEKLTTGHLSRQGQGQTSQVKDIVMAES